MKKLFIFLIIRLFIRNTDEAIKIYNTLFYTPKDELKKPSESIIGTTTKRLVEIKKPSIKKDELIESLSYLKNKSSKTKQDKDSIGVLEAVLKNMS
jgi:hypothetical protein